MPLPKRLLRVSTTLSDTPHGVGMAGLCLSCETRTHLRRFTASGPEVPGLTLGTTLVGGINCPHVALGIAGEIDRGIVISAMATAADCTGSGLVPAGIVSLLTHMA